MTPTLAAQRSLAPKDDFVGLERVAHLAAGGETPFLRSHRDVLDWFAQRKSEGMAGREAIVAATDRAKAAVGELLAVEPEAIGFGHNVAQACNIVARSLDLGPDDNVVLQAWEYPSMMYPWLRLRDRGLDVRLADDAAWRGSVEHVARAVDSRTRAIVLSHVSYFTGERHDLREYRALADEVGALLIVDASHALGAVPVDARAADFLFSCSYKWVLAAHGVAVVYWNRERQPDWRPREVGWTSVAWQDAQERGAPLELVGDGRLFELGNATLVGACLLDNAVRYILDAGVDAIERHVLDLSGALRSGLADVGVPLLTPAEDARRAGNIAFEVNDEQAWRQGLEERGVLGWTGDSRVRLSTHLYNDAADVDRAVSAVAAVFARQGSSGPRRPAPAPR
jgi:cysteine desulfurase / selenocysteine lyase